MLCSSRGKDHARESMQGLIGYKRRYCQGVKPSRVVDNIFELQFNPKEPNEILASYITYVCTDKGFLYEATVMDLFLR